MYPVTQVKIISVLYREFSNNKIDALKKCYLIKGFYILITDKIINTIVDNFLLD